MALQATSVLAVNSLGVWQAVTILALRYAWVLSFVAVGAGNAAVVGLGVRQVVCLLQVAGAAESRRDIADRDNVQRLVGPVAFAAVGIPLARLMCCMAVEAARDLFMFAVTAVTEQSCMFARCCSHLLANLLVAAEAFFTCRLDWVAQRFKRSVAFAMTGVAILELIVWFVGMATGAGCDRFFFGWQMERVTVEAAQLSAMLPPGRGQHAEFKGVAFGTVCTRQCFFPLGKKRKQKQHGK